MIQFIQILNKIIEDFHIKTGFFLHASASCIHNAASLFLGKSGAGKSTITSLISKKYNTLADDRVLIIKEKGLFYLYQVPFIEKNQIIKKNNKRYKIGNIYILRQSLNFSLQRIIDKQLMLASALQQLLVSQQNQKLKIKLLMEFVANHSLFYTLSFALDRKKIFSLIESS